MLRDFLLAQGVSPKDIAKAVKEARAVTQTAHDLASIAEKYLLTFPLSKVGKKTRFVVVQATKAAGMVRRVAEPMLAPVAQKKR